MKKLILIFFLLIGLNTVAQRENIFRFNAYFATFVINNQSSNYVTSDVILINLNTYTIKNYR